MGWYSGDLHVHRSLPDMESLMRAEDLNVASVQTVWGLKRDPDLDTWLRKAGPDGCVRVDDTCLFSVLSHEIERTRNSAMLLHRTGTTILPVADYEERELSNARLADFARRHGSIIEAEKPWWPESHIDIAVCGARLTGIANNHFTYRGYLPEHARRRTEFRDDYPDGAEGYAAYTLDLYYAYLDCGFKVSPTAGSASGVLPNPLGYNRVYVRVDGPLTFDSWMTALGEGRCFVTNGPMLFLAAGGGGPGDTVTVTDSSMSVACEVHSPVPIDRLEIVRDGGEIIHTVSPVLTDGKATVIANIPVVKSGWIAARCFEKRDDTVRFAQTAPVYVDVPGKPFKPKRYAADYFLRKTNDLVVRAETGDYPTDEARDSAMDAYQAAKSVFERLLAESE
jgi:hypothetical protein